MPLTKDQFINRFGQAELLALTDPENRETVNEKVFIAAVQDAFAEIKTILHNVIVLEPVDLPEIITAILADLTRERLYSDSQTAPVRERSKQARILLQKLRIEPNIINDNRPVDLRVSGQKSGFSFDLWGDPET